MLEHRYNVLLPQKRSEWRSPSHRWFPFEIENQRRFRLTARISDGKIVWRGWFDDREDADAFLEALGRHLVLDVPMPRELWRLPTPAWHPGIAPWVTYDFATLDFITTTSASNQTYNVPADFNSLNNTIHVVSHGANGASSGTSGGGGGYAAKANVSLTPSGTATYRLRAANSGSGTTNASWFNGTSLAGSSVGIQGASGATGAPTTSGVGDTLNAGGNGGTGSSIGGGGGGGGAAGPTGVGAVGGNQGNAPGDGGGGAGANGGSNGSTASGGNSGAGGNNRLGTGGGAADGGAGSSGGGGGGGENSVGGGHAGGTGSLDPVWDATHGPGGGGGGGGEGDDDPKGGSAGGAGGAGGLYGGGGGGGGNGNGDGVGGAGKQALIVVEYTVAVAGGGFKPGRGLTHSVLIYSRRLVA